MNAEPLFKADGSKIPNHYCGACGLVWNNENDAERCCRCSYCGKEGPKRQSYHDECWQDHLSKANAERLAKAEKLETWDGWVFYEGISSIDCHQSLSDLIDTLCCYDVAAEDWPEFVFVAVPHPPKAVDVGCIIEDILSEMWEDAEETDLNGVPELTSAVEAFNEANKTVEVIEVDYRRAVKLNKPNEP